MISKVKTRAEVRRELEQEIDHYLTTGGEIQQIDRGISGREPGISLNHPAGHFSEKSTQTRTPVTEEIKALEARKKPKALPTLKKQPKKKIIYDDFGEPLREIWE